MPLPWTENRRWNQTESAKTSERLRQNYDEWAHYHTLYREARTSWAVVPFEEVIRWAEKRSGYVIGDFGCGEAKLAEALADRHRVSSFDYVAANDDVVACYMAHVPMDDEALDVAVFSLSLMGSNFSDYLREAWRLLKLDGQLQILRGDVPLCRSGGVRRQAKRDGICSRGSAGCLEVHLHTRIANRPRSSARVSVEVLNIARADANTRAVFGDYTSIYDIQPRSL